MSSSARHGPDSKKASSVHGRTSPHEIRKNLLELLFYCLIVSILGALSLMSGNAILRKAYHTMPAACIGAVGGGVITIPTAFLIKIIIRDDRPTHIIVKAVMFVIAGASSGSIGTAILLYTGMDIGGIDILYAAWAGALGFAIFGVLIEVVPDVKDAVADVIDWCEDMMDDFWDLETSQEM